MDRAQMIAMGWSPALIDAIGAVEKGLPVPSPMAELFTPEAHDSVASTLLIEHDIPAHGANGVAEFFRAR